MKLKISYRALGRVGLEKHGSAIMNSAQRPGKTQNIEL
jgi:hypothetical protein